MSSYVLSKKPLIKKVLIISLLTLATAVGFNFFFKSEDGRTEALHSVIFYIGSFAVFTVVVSLLTLLILRILVAVGFWSK